MYKLCIKIWGYVMEDKYISVSQLTAYIKGKFTSDPQLKEVYVRGEISNYNYYRSSGHRYFSLKDEKSIIPAVFFKWDSFGLKFEPEDGMKVLVKAKVDVYPEQGKYQLYVKEIIDAGKGNLHIAFEQLKKELKAEGYFDDSHKKPIPKFPKRVGVVTSPKGAAIRDIISTIKRRWPLCEIILFPSLVQGESAKENIVKQIFLADTQFDLDTLIVGRGGGSIEDLWPFNEKMVAQTIYHCNTPVISGVGHETDFSIADFVADVRAETPTAAAVLAVPDIREVKSNLDSLDSRANRVMKKQLNDNVEKFERIMDRTLFEDPYIMLEKKVLNMDNLRTRLGSSSKEMIHAPQMKLSQIKSSNVFRDPKSIIKDKRDTFKSHVDKLLVLDPLLTIQRGYAVARTEGKIVSHAKDLKKDDELELEFKDGKVNTRVL